MNDATRLEPLLVDLARNRRDEIAWSKLYKGIWGFVLAIVFRKVRGDGELAKEICQEEIGRAHV